MNAIPYGTYNLNIQSLNAETKNIEITVDKKQQDLNVILKFTKNKLLKEVVINGKTIKQKIEEKGFAVNVIETKEVAKRNVQTNELLAQTVGVKIRQNGGLGSDIKYYINGLSGNAIRIFIDGIPISTYGSSFSLNSIPPSLIERIEVYKGVVPGHLSEDSLGGAINIVMKQSVENNFNASVSYGSFNTAQTNFSGQYRFKKSGFTIKPSAFLNYSDNDYEVWGKNVYNIKPNGQLEYVRAKRYNDMYRSLGGKMEVGFTKVKWADNFFVGVTASDSYKEVQHGTFMTIPYKGRFLDSDALLFNLTYSKRDILKNLDFNFNGVMGERNRIINDTVKWNYNWYGEQSLDLDGNPILTPNGAQQGAPTLATINRKVASFRTGLVYTLNDNHKFLLNHLFSSTDRKDDDEMKSILERKFEASRELTKNITSLSYELTLFDDKLKTTLFGKNYHQNTKQIDLTVQTIGGNDVIVDEILTNSVNTTGYGAAISYAILPKLTLLVSGEKAVRLPTENEIFGDAGDNVSANPNINPEISKNLNLGFRLSNLEFKKHSFFISANGFVRDIEDRIGIPVQTSLNSNIQTLPFVNQGNVKSKGVDAEVNYIFNKNLNLKLNVAKFELTTKDGYGIEYDLPNEPFFNANFFAQYSLKNVIQKESQLNLYYNFLFVEEFSFIRKLYGNNTGTDFFLVPNQFIQDFGFNYQFPSKKISVSFDIKNIFDKQAFDNMAVQKPGRAFYLKLNYNITNF